MAEALKRNADCIPREENPGRVKEKRQPEKLAQDGNIVEPTADCAGGNAGKPAQKRNGGTEPFRPDRHDQANPVQDDHESGQQGESDRGDEDEELD